MINRRASDVTSGPVWIDRRRVEDVDYTDIDTVTATFGDLVYETNGEIDLPVVFSEAVLHFAKSDCRIVNLSGDSESIYNMDYLLSGSGENYKLTFSPVLGTSGGFMVEVSGYVYITRNRKRASVLITPQFVAFNSRTPKIIEETVPAVLAPGTWDVLWELDIPDVGLDADNLLYIGEIEGADFDSNPPAIYRTNVLDVLPELPRAPDNPSLHPAIVGEWFREGLTARQASRYILIRFNMPETAAGRFEVRPKDGAFRPIAPVFV